MPPKQRQEIHAWPVLSDSTPYRFGPRQDSLESLLSDPEETWQEILTAAQSAMKDQQAQERQKMLERSPQRTSPGESHAASPSKSGTMWNDCSPCVKSRVKKRQANEARAPVSTYMKQHSPSVDELKSPLALESPATTQAVNNAVLDYLQRVKRSAVESSDDSGSLVAADEIPADSPKLVPPTTNLSYLSTLGSSSNSLIACGVPRAHSIKENSPFVHKGLFRSQKDGQLNPMVQQKSPGVTYTSPKQEGQLSAMLEHEAPGLIYTNPKQEVNAIEKRLAEMQDSIAQLNRQCADFEMISSDVQGVPSEEYKSLLLQHAKLMEEAGTFLDDVDREVVEADVMSPDDQHGLDELQSLVSTIRDGRSLSSFQPPPGLAAASPGLTFPQLHFGISGANGVSQVPYSNGVNFFVPPTAMGPPAGPFRFGVAGPAVPQNNGRFTAR